MKIAIDCRSLRKKPSGIPNFLVSAINGITKSNPTWHIYLLTNESFNKELQKGLILNGNVKIIESPLPILNQVSFLWLLFKVPKIVAKIKPDIYWAPAFLLPPSLPENVLSLVTIHDLVFKDFRQTMSWINKLFFYLLHDKSINSAHLLWSNSFYTKAGIERYFPHRKCKDIFVGFFINTDLFKCVQVPIENKRSILLKYGVSEKFLLFVGTLEPRKNLEFLLSLMPDLARDGYSLLVVGANGWGETNIKNIVQADKFPNKKVIFAGFITTQELVLLYNLASIFISTSLNEGFGMPQLEAMACGCPVVSPHNSAMIEVVEGAGETVKTWAKEEWVNTINHVFNNRLKYVEMGFLRVVNYQNEVIFRRLNEYLNQHIQNIR